MYHSGILALPPLLPIVRKEFFGVGDVTNWGVKPNVENLALCILQRNWNTPVQISGNCSWFETSVYPALTLAVNVYLPLFVAVKYPLLKPAFILIQRKIPVLGHLLKRLLSAQA